MATAKKTAAKKAAAKKAVNSFPVAPATAPGSPAKYRVRVRMYRHGLGDCFLLTFPRKGKAAPLQMLIDCGALARDGAFMTGLVEHIHKTVAPNGGKGRLDVVAATHEHKDHLSGFNQAREVFNTKFDFGAVWLGWTENLTKPEIEKIKSAKRKTAETLRAALRLRGIGAALGGVEEVLQFSAADDTTGSGTVAEALEYLKLRGTEAGALRYLEPGQAPLALEGVDGVRVYVLGPPQDPILLKGSEVTGKMKRDGVIYHLGATGAVGLEALGAAAGVEENGDGERFSPFAAEHRITRQSIGEDRADLGGRVAALGGGEVDLAGGVLDILDHMHQPGQADFPGLGADLGLDVGFGAIALARGAGIGIFQRAEHDRTVDQLLAGDRIGDLEKLQPVCGNGHRFLLRNWYYQRDRFGLRGSGFGRCFCGRGPGR